MAPMGECLHVRVELRWGGLDALAAGLPGFSADARFSPVHIPAMESGDMDRVVMRGSVRSDMLEMLRRDPRVLDVYLDAEARAS
jgi:hypothetical protein